MSYFLIEVNRYAFDALKNGATNTANEGFEIFEALGVLVLVGIAIYAFFSKSKAISLLSSVVIGVIVIVFAMTGGLNEFLNLFSL